MQRVGTPRRPQRLEGGELAARHREVRLRHHILQGERLEHALAAELGLGQAVAAQRVHRRRRLWNGRQQRDLRPAQIRHRLVEVPARRMGDAVAAIAVRHQPQIVAQDRLAVVAGRQQQRRAGLHRLGPQRARRRVLHAGDLHGDGRSAGDTPAARQVLPGRPPQRQRIDAWMVPEAPVLQRQGRLHDPLRQPVDGPEAVVDPHLSFVIGVLVADLRQERAVAIIQQRRRRRRYEHRPLRSLTADGDAGNHKDDDGRAAAREGDRPSPSSARSPRGHRLSASRQGAGLRSPHRRPPGTSAPPRPAAA